ncbi:EthD family reductase [Pseudonocardia sp. N23]|uniref:EthD family reductase n=1 Tax=Pseudonocardia sp. N23 TaxID=1987376 RepID=UPI000BFD49A5|nr:EthD family reductase [Pseudonocardia sp. N23]GAY12275.1 possible ethyl tert-butyl ether degradation protein EthD [Pseudonocardia sp. N23]
MSYQLTALYNHPSDVAAFDKHYDDVHAVLAAKLPDVRSFSISRPQPGPDGTKPDYHLIAVLVWDSAEAAGASLGSEAGKEAVADLDNFAGAGVTMLTGPSTAVV